MKKIISLLLCLAMFGALAVTAFAYDGENYVQFSTGKVTFPQNQHIAGDSNGDGVVSTLDIMATLKYIVGNKSSTLRDSVDNNNDGKVNIADAIRIIRHVLGDDVGLGELVG